MSNTKTINPGPHRKRFNAAMATTRENRREETSAQTTTPILTFNSQRTIGTNLSPYREAGTATATITAMDKFKAFSFEELRLADRCAVMSEEDKRAREAFGLPTAPPTPELGKNVAATEYILSSFSTQQENLSSIDFTPQPKIKAAAVKSRLSSPKKQRKTASSSLTKLNNDSYAKPKSIQKPQVSVSASKTADKTLQKTVETDKNVPAAATRANHKNLSAPISSVLSLSSTLATSASTKSPAMDTSATANSEVDSFKTFSDMFSALPVSPKKAVPKDKEYMRYMRLHHTKDAKTSGADEQLRTTPLLSLSVKTAAEARNTTTSVMFPQYAYLGCHMPEPSSKNKDPEPEPVLLNTNTPWSAFICGSQGSGKSYTLSAIIENCLFASTKIGKLPKPLAGVVFHNNTASSHNICEAAHLVSLGVKVNVLVSRSNYHALSSIYKAAVSPEAAKLLDIQPLVLQSHHLTAERMHRLMAFQEGDTAVPLYMEVIMRILREMAITGLPFSYSTFKRNLDAEGLLPGQKVMMEMRLNLLESFLDASCIKPNPSATKSNMDMFSTRPATLTIVDLSDPFLDSSTTCTLFDILLSLFLSSRPTSGMLVCLDEAHKFMKNTPAAETFTENLLTVIREQRHNATRVVVATQEPTISPKLLDLCSITMVHRFTSPDWLATLRGHLAAASDLVTSAAAADEGGEEEEGSKRLGAQRLFEKIITLDVGESLLFAPSAVLMHGRDDQAGGRVQTLGTKCVRFKTRVRLGEDGGRSILAIRE
jgi:hypothetical protein